MILCTLMETFIGDLHTLLSYEKKTGNLIHWTEVLLLL